VAEDDETREGKKRIPLDPWSSSSTGDIWEVSNIPPDSPSDKSSDRKREVISVPLDPYSNISTDDEVWKVVYNIPDGDTTWKVTVDGE
jgi:hypothetical protein